MKRNAASKLHEWKNQEMRTPLLLYGLKGCGKTYLAMDFAKSSFEGLLYVNLEQDTILKRQLENGCKKILEQKEAQAAGELTETAERQEAAEQFFLLLAEIFDVPVEYLAGFLVVFDEIVASKSLYRLVCGFAKEKWTLCLLAITSRFPEGYMPNTLNGLKLYPLQFDEYLQAVGSEWYAEVIKGHYQTRHRIPNMVHNELLSLFEDYLTVGGMPSAIHEYLLFRTADNVAQIHKNLYGMWHYHIEQEYEESLAVKMKQVLDVIPKQLQKENQKFQYRHIRRGATGALYQQAIQTLLQNYIVIGCTKAEENRTENGLGSFKLFPADVGIYCSKALRGAQNPFQKDILDCYVAQTFNALQYRLYFWESSSQARVDFLLQAAGSRMLIPIEMKTDNARLKSAGIYRSHFDVPYSIRLSFENFEFTDQIWHIPYYAAFCLHDLYSAPD